MELHFSTINLETTGLCNRSRGGWFENEVDADGPPSLAGAAAAAAAEAAEQANTTDEIDRRFSKNLICGYGGESISGSGSSNAHMFVAPVNQHLLVQQEVDDNRPSISNLLPPNQPPPLMRSTDDSQKLWQWPPKRPHHHQQQQQRTFRWIHFS
jgi:hypothetical protein